jgi:hypothetical protein
MKVARVTDNSPALLIGLMKRQLMKPKDRRWLSSGRSPVQQLKKDENISGYLLVIKNHRNTYWNLANLQTTIKIENIHNRKFINRNWEHAPVVNVIPTYQVGCKKKNAEIN